MSSLHTIQPGEPRRGTPSTESLALKLPSVIQGRVHADVRPSKHFHWILDESHTSLANLAGCERSWYLRSGLERAIDIHEIAILKSLSTLSGGMGTLVHDGIRKMLGARREILSLDGRPLKESAPLDFEAVSSQVNDRFAAMVSDSWRECFPNGRADHNHPRFVEHIKLKHVMNERAEGDSLVLASEAPAQERTVELQEQVINSLKNWHEIFYQDRDDCFRNDPRELVPPGGIQKLDPVLMIELEERSIGYLKQDGLELLATGDLNIPFYELDVAIDTPPVSNLASTGIPATFHFRIRDVVDFVYLTFTSRGEPRLVAMDWKTNTLDEHSGAPGYRVQEDHLTQLKHHAVYLLQRYGDIFKRYDKEISHAFQRLGKPRPPLPARLTADMVYVGDVYLAGGELSAPYRFKPVCAADLDLDLFINVLRARLADKVAKFHSVEPISTDLAQWAPSGLERKRCESCHQAPLCPDVPKEVRDEWPASVSGLLSKLTVPYATSLDTAADR